MSHTQRKINIDTTSDITHAAGAIKNPFFHTPPTPPTSAEINACISEISCFLGLMARWLRGQQQREIAARRDWAYSGGW